MAEMTNQLSIPSASELIEEARESTGLNDFGYPPIEEALTVFVNALNSEARLNATGIAMRTSSIQRILATRLKIADKLKRHPEIRDEVVSDPIVVLGLARSGTTKVQRMAAADKRLQSLPLWRLLDPIDDGTPTSVSDRCAVAGAMVQHMKQSFPDFVAAHPMQETEPDEEVFMMEQTLQNNTLMHSSGIPSYGRWLKKQSFEGWYDYLKTMLQLFQHEDGSAGQRWLLKAPFHLGHLPLLFDKMPNAIIAHCHRDPVEVIPSMCRLFEASRCMASDEVDRNEIGKLVLDVWSGLMNTYLADRPRLEESRCFVDVPYSLIRSDGIGAIKKIYDQAGIDMTPEAERSMRVWEEHNSQHKHGKNDYSLERFGLSANIIRDYFSDYISRYQDQF